METLAEEDKIIVLDQIAKFQWNISDGSYKVIMPGSLLHGCLNELYTGGMPIILTNCFST